MTCSSKLSVCVDYLLYTVVRCCRGLPNSLEKEAFQFLRTRLQNGCDHEKRQIQQRCVFGGCSDIASLQESVPLYLIPQSRDALVNSNNNNNMACTSYFYSG